MGPREVRGRISFRELKGNFFCLRFAFGLQNKFVKFQIFYRNTSVSDKEDVAQKVDARCQFFDFEEYSGLHSDDVTSGVNDVFLVHGSEVDDKGVLVL